MQIIQMKPADWPEVARIYAAGIATGNATFQTEVPSWEDWDKAHVKELRFIASDGNKILGWAALTPVSGRCVYAGVAEVSVYIDADSRGKGVGKLLLQQLIENSERQGFWTLQAGIFPENTASLKIHHALGFRTIGTREKIGKMNGVWRDTVLLERRSVVAGME